MTLPKLLFTASLALATPAVANEALRVPGLSDGVPKLELPACENIPYSQENCVRVLACVGKEGVIFDGQARGWDTGDVVGQLSSGEVCAGTWRSGGFMGTGRSSVTCEGDLSIEVLYHTLHNETGTVEGSGVDSSFRRVQVWSGLSILEFIERETGKVGVLPCGTRRNPVDVPIS